MNTCLQFIDIKIMKTLIIMQTMMDTSKGGFWHSSEEREGEHIQMETLFLA